MILEPIYFPNSESLLELHFIVHIFEFVKQCSESGATNLEAKASNFEPNLKTGYSEKQALPKSWCS